MKVNLFVHINKQVNVQNSEYSFAWNLKQEVLLLQRGQRVRCVSWCTWQNFFGDNLL